MEQKIGSDNKRVQVTKRKLKQKEKVHKVRGKRIKNLNEKLETGKNFKHFCLNLKKRISKKTITYLFLIMADVFLIIYVARKNVVNYADFFGKSIFVGEKKNLFLGRNNISLIVTLFFYLYICLMNRFFLKQKNTKKFFIGLLLFLVILNGVLFYCFTTRVY